MHDLNNFHSVTSEKLLAVIINYIAYSRFSLHGFSSCAFAKAQENKFLIFKNYLIAFRFTHDVRKNLFPQNKKLSPAKISGYTVIDLLRHKFSYSNFLHVCFTLLFCTYCNYC